MHYAGRDYEDSSTCAGAAWCRGDGPPDCTISDWFKSYGYFVFPFSRYAVLRAPTPAGMTTMGVYVKTGANCYIGYSLEGGP